MVRLRGVGEPQWILTRYQIEDLDQAIHNAVFVAPFTSIAVEERADITDEFQLADLVEQYKQ